MMRFDRQRGNRKRCPDRRMESLFEDNARETGTMPLIKQGDGECRQDES